MAFEKIDQEGIPSDASSRYYDVLYKGHRYPPKLVVSWANEFANGKVLERTTFSGGKDTPCFQLLEREGFAIVPKQNEISKMDQTAKIYEFKAGVADRNSINLQSPDGKYIYWNEAKFKNNEKGDFIFFVNRYQKFAIFATVALKGITAIFNSADNISRFNHENNSYDVEGEWKDFVRFDIIEKVKIPENWNWSRQLGQSETYDLWKPKIKEIENRIEKVEDLFKLFVDGEANDQLIEIRGLLETNIQSMEIDISNALDWDWIKMLMNSEEFVFQAGVDILNEIEAFKGDPVFFSTLQEKFVNETRGKKTGFVEFLNQYEKSSKEYQFILLSGKLIAHIDFRGAKKNEWNSYEDQRVLADSRVNQSIWFRSLLNFKEQGSHFERLPDGSVKNAFLYLKDPKNGSTMLSEKHRELVSKKIFNLPNYDPNSFVNNLISFFAPYKIEVVNEENRTAILSSILYHDSIKKIWESEKEEEPSIQGLITADSTGWQNDFVKALAGDEYDSAVIWWDKQPSGTTETIEALREKIKNDGFFDFYMSSGNSVNYKARVINFANAEDYVDMNWDLAYTIYGFQENFDDYSEERNGGVMKARIVYLIDQMEEINDPLSVKDFTFYKNFTVPTQNNCQPFVAIKTAHRVWFVCQGTTYNDAQGKKYLWAPLKDKRGSGKYYWDNLRKVKKGDYIFHYSDGLRGLSMAESAPFEAVNPMENTDWDSEGVQVNIERLFEFEEPIHYTTLRGKKDNFDNYLKEVQGPFDTKGEIKQGYLFDFNRESGSLVRQIYGNSFPEPFESFFKSDQDLTTAQSPKEILNHIHQYILGKGYYFKMEDIANFYLSLKTKPFVILAGISGTGKTQLVRKFAEAIGCKDTCDLIPVKPDWTDNSDLIGYLDLQQNFQPQKVLELIKKAHANLDKPYFLVLDEMNLARVEYYFSDFLSIIETREKNDNGQITTDPLLKKEELGNEHDRQKYGGISIPENLYVIGTVNMDETTHPFSRKVLDRANSIEMNQIDLAWQDNSVEREVLGGVFNDFLKTMYVNSKDLTSKDKGKLEKPIKLLQEINHILKQADLHFAYRVRDEIAFYLLNNVNNKLLNEEKAMDYQIMQKILPRIQGSSPRIEKIIKDLLILFSTGLKIDEKFTYEEVLEAFKKVESKYPLSTEKLLFMLKRFDDDGFTSFWQ
ncbi:MAG: AAA family ATPase [Leptospiraceae bacterium]|nr:AAA family ATPase [Leptospiraceae bacterium]